jgi:uncharacterized repeat protein (TIGR01451 family)
MRSIHTTLRSLAHRPVAALIALASVATLAFAIPAAQAAPTIDGNLTDLIDFGNSLKNSGTGFGVAIVDKPDAGGLPTPELIYNDAKFIPCPQPQPALNTHWVNGTEIFNHYLAYVPGSTKLYLGLRSEGFIGDDDGDGDPDLAGNGAANCNPNDNIDDLPGIAGNDVIAWTFDLDCDGVSDASLKITDNVLSGTGLFLGATGVIAFKQNAGTGATGHDLEVEATLPNPLPAAFKYVRVETNAFDGLTEDRSDGVTLIGNPVIKVTKSAEPTTICAGGKTRFTINIQNQGTTPLSVVATDQLPGVLSFAGNVSSTCGGAQDVQGNVIKWGPFDLAAGGSCTISFDAQSSPECFGTATNVVDVDGTFTSACIPEGGAVTVTDHAEATITCGAGPCVQTRANCDPGKACPGAPIAVTGYAKNCSTTATEDISLTVAGTVFSITGVGPGVEVSRSVTVPMPTCTSGEQVAFNVSATASNDCGTTKPAPASCSVLCSTPQVEVSKSADPAGAVDQGTVLHYTITVTNPSKDVALENVKVTDTLCDEVNYSDNANPGPTSAPAEGSSGVIVWDIASIPVGGSVTITFDGTVRTLPNPDCERTDRSCTNNVVVVGNCADAQARAEASYTTPINPCLQPGLCRLTGGGCLNEDGGNRGHKQSTFGGNSSPAHDGGGPTGNSWEHVYRDGKTILFNWHSWDAHVIACSVVPPGPCSPHANNTRADFVGTGKYSIGAGGRSEDGNQVAYIIDHKEGACNKSNRDEYGIIVRKGLVIGQGEIVFQTSGEIDCGNLQIHETPARIFGSGTTLPANETGGVAAVALLNRAYPNPFSGRMNYAYKVAEGGSSVDVGVYNVAGRLVKTLASGAQGAGTYTLTWDGSDDSGVRMSPGVYFLKARVGGESFVSRVIYVAQ